MSIHPFDDRAGYRWHHCKHGLEAEPHPEAKRVLAIDGVGIRGIIPALVSADIEHRTGRQTSDLFDLIAGTSTGGIIALRAETQTFIDNRSAEIDWLWELVAR